MSIIYFDKGWKAEAEVDDDGCLNIYVTNSDGTDIFDADTEHGDGTNGEQYAMRFSTLAIEEAYWKEQDRLAAI